MNRVLILSVLLLLPSTQSGAATLHVSKAGDGADGLSWETAYTTIGEALAVSASGDDIWVASGTYTESPMLKSGVNLYGGYPDVGGNDQHTQRDWRRYETIIQSEPSGSAMSAESDVVCEVDGFVITGGSSSGVFIRNSTITILNCLITENQNRRSPREGGGIASYSSKLLIRDVTVSHNHATRGGGLYGENSIISLTNCYCDNNHSRFGGGIGVLETSQISLRDCHFSNNETTGVFGFSGGLGDPVVVYYSPGIGGAIGVSGESIMEMDSCTLRSNTSDFGAGIYLHTSEGLVRNTLLVGGSGTGGVGIYSSNAVLSTSNCTLAANIADGDESAGSRGGSGLWVGSFRGSDAKMENTILMNEGPNEIVGEVLVSYSNIQGGWAGPGNIDADPLFVDPDNGDFRLQPGSPCIDSASITGPATDLDGNPRPLDLPGQGRDGTGDEFDMGAYEFVPPTPTPGPTLVNPRSDIDGSDRVDAKDLLILLNDWKKVTGG